MNNIQYNRSTRKYVLFLFIFILYYNFVLIKYENYVYNNCKVYSELF